MKRSFMEVRVVECTCNGCNLRGEVIERLDTEIPRDGSYGVGILYVVSYLSRI